MSQPRDNPYLTHVSKDFLLQKFKVDQSVSLNRINDALEEIWDFGRNVVVGWSHGSHHIDLCYCPIGILTDGYQNFPRVFEGTRLIDPSTFRAICDGLAIPNIRIHIPGVIGTSRYSIKAHTINNLIKRYCISYTANRAVILFDIVKFSLKSPTEQLLQLKTLEYYIDKAARIMAENDLPVDLQRSTTGDGYYIWNNTIGGEHNIRTYIAFAIMLTLNRLSDTTIPLRAAFAIGSHFTYHHVDTVPRGIEYIVGDVTIKLSRVINSCADNQILISFQIDDHNNVIDFMNRCQETIDGMRHLHLYSRSIIDIRTYLTGYKGPNGFEVQRYGIIDKHGIRHVACNIKLNVYFYDKDSIRIGRMTSEVSELGHIAEIP